MKKSLCDLSYSELISSLESASIPKFRAKQIFHWIYKKYRLDEELLKTNLDQKTKQALQDHFSFSLLRLQKKHISTDKQTIKYLWKLEDGSFVESVLIYAPGRKTLCVSSQVGCPIGCVFCASGKNGFIRNLSTAEIIEQIIRVNSRLIEEDEQTITHVVFMGMGEPLLNDKVVKKAISLITDPEGLHISSRRVTISTVGITDRILLLAECGLKVNLALSLHAPTQRLREKLIPAAKSNPIEGLLKAVDQYFLHTRRDITFEYILINGVNDSNEHAKQLISLVKKRHISVNLIPYNPVEGFAWKRPQRERIEAFISVLKNENIPVICRYTKGKDIGAACGQLALVEEVFS